jgi:aspartate/methionine/tyrosine aminotransferase
VDPHYIEPEVPYLRWAKLHQRARYELTNSGVPTLRPTDLGAALPVSLEVRGAYGDPDLIQTIAELYGVCAGAVVPVPGTSSANFMAIAATTKPGDCIMLERPVYQPLQQVTHFLGLNVITLSRLAKNHFLIDVAEVDAGLDRGARAVVLTNLHNPSGQPLRADLLRTLAARCARVNATLIVDEVYLDAAFLTGHAPRWTAASLAENVVATGSLTKIYGLGGLRTGWLIASPPVVERLQEIMDLLSVENSAPSAALALHAFANLKTLEDRYRHFHRTGQKVFRQWLAGEPRVDTYANHGAVFECVRLPEGVDSTRFCDLLFREYDTQVVDGRFFGLPDHIRISTAVTPDDLAQGLSRLSDGLTKAETALGS